MDRNAVPGSNPEVVDAADLGIKPETKPELTVMRSVGLPRTGSRGELSRHQQAVRNLPRLQMAVLPKPSVSGNDQHFVQLRPSEVRHPALQHGKAPVHMLQHLLAQPSAAGRIWVCRKQVQVAKLAELLDVTRLAVFSVREVADSVWRRVAHHVKRLQAGRASRARAHHAMGSSAVPGYELGNIDEFIPKGVKRGFQVGTLWGVQSD